METKVLKQITSELNGAKRLYSPSFSVDQAAESLAQVTIVPQVELKMSLLGKRGFDDPKRDEFIRKLKREKVCCACGKSGHWWQENDECVEIVKRKRAAAKKEKRKKDEPPPTMDKSNSHF